ncbi:hypothetical protein BGZ68_008229 [Mortierella alpina]|nr:hypothetical protein BGZ68_008229 [Mortierella alpina]
MRHHQHLPHEGNVQGQRDNLSTANVAVPTGAAAGLAGGATGAKLASAAYMGNKSEMVAPRDISHENIVDKTLPPAPSQHTAYLPHGDGAAARTSDNRSHGSSVASTIGAAGLGAATGAGAAKAYQNHTTNTAATHDISHDNTTMGNVSGIDRTNVDQRAGKDTTGTVVNPVYADAPVVQNVSSTKVHDARPLTQKLVDKPPASANAGNSTKHGAGKAAATAAIASGAGFTAYLGSKESLNRHGVAHPEDHTAEHQQQYRPLTEKIRGAFGAPLYGPADPMDLPLTDPKTLLPLPTHAKIPAARTSPKSEALSAAAATTAGAAAGTAAYLGDKESRRTSGHHVGDQVPDHHQQRRRSLGEIIKETVGGHHYGPADPKDLPLTDPKTVRPLGSIASDTAATTAAGAATAAAVGAGAHHAHSKDTAKNDNTADSAMRTSVPVATSAGTVASGIHAAQAKDDVKKYDTTMSSATPPSHSYKPSAANAAGPATAAATAGAGIHALRNKDDAKNYDTKPSSTAATSHTSAPVMNKTDQTETPHSTAPVATAGLTGAAAVPAAALGAHRPPATTFTANVGPTAYRENVQTDPTAHRENTPTGPTAYRENVQTGNRENVQTGNLNSNLGTRSQQMTDIGSNAAPPTDYHGQMPQAKPGEEVVWVKKITTTDYYDDENLDEPTGVIEDSNRDRADYHANVNTSNTDYGGKHQGGLRTDENVQQQQRQEQLEHGTQRPHHGGLVDRLLGRHHDEADKGKERL